MDIPKRNSPHPLHIYWLHRPTERTLTPGWYLTTIQGCAAVCGHRGYASAEPNHRFRICCAAFHSSECVSPQWTCGGRYRHHDRYLFFVIRLTMEVSTACDPSRIEEILSLRPTRFSC